MMSDPVGRGKQTPEEALRGLEEWAVAEGLDDEALTLLGLAIAEVGAGAPNLMLRQAVLRARKAGSVEKRPDLVGLASDTLSGDPRSRRSTLMGVGTRASVGEPARDDGMTTAPDSEPHERRRDHKAFIMCEPDGRERSPTPEEEAWFRRLNRWREVRAAMATLSARLSADGYGRADDLLLHARATSADWDTDIGRGLLSACENLTLASRKWRAALSAVQQDALLVETEEDIVKVQAVLSGVNLSRGNVRDESGGVTLPPDVGEYAQILWPRLRRAAVSKELLGHADVPLIAREELRRAGYLRVEKGRHGGRNIYVLLRPPDRG